MYRLLKISTFIFCVIQLQFATAQNLSQNKKYEDALAVFESIKDIKPQNSDSLVSVYLDIISLLNFNSTKNAEVKLIINTSDKLMTLGKNKLALEYLTKLSERKDLDQSINEDMYSMLGYVFKNLEAYELSNTYLNLSVSSKKEKDNGYVYSAIGINYLSLNQFDSASFYFKKQYFDATRFEGKKAAANALNNAGWSFMKEGLYDSAMIYFNRSISEINSNHLIEDKDSSTLYNVYGNKGLTFKRLKKIDSSLFYLLKDYNYGLENKSDTYLFQISKDIIQLYLSVPKYKLAKKHLNHYESIKDKLTVTQQKELIELKIEYNQLTNNSKLNNQLISEYISLSNSETLELNQRVVTNNSYIAEFLSTETKLKTKLQASIIKGKDADLKSANQLKNSLIIGVLLVTILLVLLLFVFILYKRQSKLKTQLLSESKQALEVDLRLKNQDLTNLAITINQRHDYSKELLEKLLKINLLDENNVKSRLQELILDLKGINSIEKSKQNFYENFDIINAAFFDSINKKHPGLTKKEKELCALVRLGLNNKEISVIKNVSLNSVKVSKHRLKSKIIKDQSKKRSRLLW